MSATLSPIGNNRYQQQRFDERSSFECCANLIKECLEKCEIQMKGMDDGELLNTLQKAEGIARGRGF